MHEYSIVQSLFDRIDEQAKAHGAAAVTRLRLRIGSMSGVEVDLLKSAYELFRQGTICENAEMEVVFVQAVWGCQRCEQPIPTGGPLRCGTCDTPARLIEGDEIVLDQLELEVP
jgi:hydrogenase nickel incorporation protein HypA/HybF